MRIVYIDILADIDRAIDGGMVDYIELTRKEWIAFKARRDIDSMRPVLAPDTDTHTITYRGIPIVILDR